MTQLTPSVARGAALAVALATCFVAGRALLPWLPATPRHPQPVCAKPVQITDPTGRARLACANDPAVSRCSPLHAGDAINLRNGNGCIVQPQAMVAAWRLLVGLPVDINVATVADLQEIPGIGPKTAVAIVRHRRGHGPFRSLQNLRAVRGVGPAKLARFAPFLTVAH